MPENLELLNTVVKQDNILNRIYAAMSRDLALVLRKYKVNNNSKLWFKNQAVKQEVEAVMRRYQSIIFKHITESATASWQAANKQNDNLVNKYIKGITLPNQSLYFKRNTEALQAFLKRRDNGLNLSDRVWNLTKQTQSQLEYFIANGLTTGRSASKMATDLNQFLKNPDKRFRRKRNPVTGRLILSEPAKDYKPGNGIYRSSYKNALRLARNEISMAYRASDFERRKQLPFVLGVTVNLSAAHPQYDICDELQGDYPKEFKFVGWHPNCLCFTTSKLATREDFIKQIKGGTIAQNKYVKAIPNRAAKYLRENSDRISNFKSKPYFIADNFKNSKDGYVLKKSVGITKPFTEPKEDGIISSLKKLGIDVNPNKEAFSAFKERTPGFNLTVMFNDLEKQLADSGIKNIKKSVYFRKDGFDFLLKARNFEMQRKITYNEGYNSVYHAYLRLPKNTQGGGLTKKMFQTLYRQYESGNITRINVTANIDVGGYAWARYGFSATKKDEVLKIINTSRNIGFKRLAKRKTIYHYNRYGNDAAFPMRRLTTIAGGKEALLNSWWSGTINLLNKEERERFLEYLFK